MNTTKIAKNLQARYTIGIITNIYTRREANMSKKKRRPNPDDIRQKQGVRNIKLYFGSQIELRYQNIGAQIRVIKGDEVYAGEITRDEAKCLNKCMNTGGQVELLYGYISVEVPKTYCRTVHFSYDSGETVTVEISHSEIELLNNQLNLIA